MFVILKLNFRWECGLCEAQLDCRKVQEINNSELFPLSHFEIQLRK